MQKSSKSNTRKRFKKNLYRKMIIKPQSSAMADGCGTVLLYAHHGISSHDHKSLG